MVWAGLSAPLHATLTEGARLAAIYDSILDARFERASELIAAACPPAPLPACEAMRAVSLWWQVLLHPESRTFDATFERAADAAVASAARWTEREPRRAEAWFYLAGSYAPLVQWRVLRGERLAAARDGLRIKEALERALALDPSLQDAFFGIGLYHYYAAVAPAPARVLRWLLFLPGGNKAQGLQEMLKAREGGELLRGEADYQLHWIYLWYEDNPRAALALVQGLDAKYPGNPLFLQRVAEIQTEYFRADAAARDAWQALLDRARSSDSPTAKLADTRARLGLAQSLIALGGLAAAIDHLTTVIEQRRREPSGAVARAQLLLGDAHHRGGKRELAAAAYRAAIAHAPEDDPMRIKARAREALRRKF